MAGQIDRKAIVAIAVPDHGYTRSKTVISASSDPAHVSMPAARPWPRC